MRATKSMMSGVVALAAFAGMVGAQAADQAKPGPVKVFILAGDSNCEGKAATSLMEHLLANPETAPTYKHLKKADGAWAVRNDVWIRYLERKGNLSVGYGCAATQFGIELQFGNVVGDSMKNQVLLIKTAWGGSGLSRNFASPSSGSTNNTCYVQMIDNIKDTFKNMKTLFPGYDEAKGYELAGFVWFSGWNDAGMQNYDQSLASLIKDVRKEFGVTNMPVVIGELGVGGPDQPGKENPMRKAQRAVAERPEFKGTVKYVETAQYFDMKAFAMFRDGTWKTTNKDEFAKISSDRPFHFMGSAKTFFMMGDAMGKGMVELLQR